MLKRGHYVKEGTMLKRKMKKAGYYLHQLFTNKSAVMFDIVNIQQKQ